MPAINGLQAFSVGLSDLLYHARQARTREDAREHAVGRVYREITTKMLNRLHEYGMMYLQMQTLMVLKVLMFANRLHHVFEQMG